MRQRLSWDKDKVAAINKKADPYTMNQDHTNNPIEKYHTGDPSTWNEDPNMGTPWKNEGRLETGHPAPSAGPAPAPVAAPAAPAAPAMAPEQQAVMAARKLEDKALKCITIAQRMLPGAADDLIECQATDLMYMPDRCIMATLQRQAELAEVLADDDGDDDDDAKKDAPVVPGTPEAPKAAADAVPPVKPEDEKDEVEAAKKPEEKKPEDVPAAAPAAPVAPGAAPAVPPVMAKKEEEEKVDPKAAPEGDDGMDLSASADLLDLIFAENSDTKTGAKKLSGLVKQASSEGSLNNLWDAPPDVSKAFR